MKKIMMVVYMCLFATISIRAQVHNNSLQKIPQMTTELEKVNRVLNIYLEGMVQKDTNKIEQIFYQKAEMFFMQSDKLMQVPVFPGLIAYIKQTPEDKEAKERVVSADITGSAATGKVEVISRNMVYTDYFNLLKIDGEWKIINKAFTVNLQSNK